MRAYAAGPRPAVTMLGAALALRQRLAARRARRQAVRHPPVELEARAKARPARAVATVERARVRAAAWADRSARVGAVAWPAVRAGSLGAPLAAVLAPVTQKGVVP